MDPLRLVAVLSEAALLQQMGGVDVQRAQLRHLADMVEAHPDTIELRILPSATPGCSVIGAATFHLVDFATPRLPTLVWVEMPTGISVLSDELQARELDLRHKDAYQRGLSREDSLEMVRRYAEA